MLVKWGTGLSMLVLIVASTGCGRGAAGPDRPHVTPAQGVVIFDGQPLTDANVVLRSANGSPGAIGLTDSEGRFKLQTFEPGDGAIPGTYQVIVTKYDVPAYDPKAEISDGDTEGDGVEAKSLIPHRYSNPQRSGLTAEVIDGAKNDFTFTLTK